MARPRTKRQRAFANEVSGWLPAIGESVYVRRTAGNLSFVKSIGEVTGSTLFEDAIEVTIRRGPHRYVGIWRVEDLRPAHPRAVAVGVAPAERR